MAKAKKPACKHVYGPKWKPITRSDSGLHILARPCNKCGEEQRKLAKPAVFPDGYDIASFAFRATR